MNENAIQPADGGTFKRVISDDGVQRAAAGVVVAVVVSVAKNLIFGRPASK